jgi:hypothetical protein
MAAFLVSSFCLLLAAFNPLPIRPLDATRPHSGDHARKKYGEHKICDERFSSYRVPAFVELIFPDWSWS